MQTDINENTRVALYARVSTEEQREGQTIDSQITELENFAGQKGWLVADIYRDEGWSGSILVRPDLDRLRDDAPRNLFDAVLINDVDRLARDVTHLGIIKRDLERHGIRVIFRKLPAESSPAHNLLVNILGSFAEFEREMIGDRTRRGKRHKVEVRKQFLGAQPAYGFRYILKERSTAREGRLEIVLEEATIVRLMYQWVAQEGLSARRVVARLNQLKVPTRRGGKVWRASSVRHILRSEIYIGIWHYYKHYSCEPARPSADRRYRKSVKTSRRLRPRSEWLPVVLPEELKIVERAVWQQVQKQLDQNRTFSPRNSKHNYFLRGLVRCGGCSSPYVGDPCHGRFYYRCLARCKKYPIVKEDVLNITVWRAVAEAILNPRIVLNQVVNLTESMRERSTQDEQQKLEVEGSLKQLEAEESRVVEAYRMGVLPARLLGQELEKINTRRSFLQATKASLAPAIEFPGRIELKRHITDYCNRAAARLKEFSDEERQRFLRVLIDSVVFKGSRVRIRGRIPVSHSSQMQCSEVNPLQASDSDEAREGQPGIATTTTAYYGRNTASDFQDPRDISAANYFHFELERPIVRPSPQTDKVGEFAA
jgi:site-specific DNA recombinase